VAQDRYGSDVLSHDPHAAAASAQVPTVVGEMGLVLEDAETGWCGAVTGWQRGPDGWAVMLEDRHGRTRLFAAGPRFLVDGALVSVTRGPRYGAASSDGLGVRGRCRDAGPDRPCIAHLGRGTP
jgi:hypothetical protein